MTKRKSAPPPINTDSHDLSRWLLALFGASGCAALIWQVVSVQWLQLIVGSSGVSRGLLLGTYLSGLCIGSIALPRMISTKHHPLRVYGLLEFGIVLVGFLVLLLLPFAGRLYVAGATDGPIGTVLRGILAAACLLPGAMLTGATLPVIARYLESTKNGISRVGFLYGAGIAGAGCGCLLAGFYLLKTYDLNVAMYAAAAFNTAAGLVSMALIGRTRYPVTVYGLTQASAPSVSGARLIYITVALSGLCALGAQIVWTRLLSLILGPTVYTFFIILAMLLAGLAIGVHVGSFWAARTRRPRIALGVCQMVLAAAITWTALMLAQALPYWPIDPWLSLSPWFNFQIDLARTLWATFPATMLWGASFPLALAAGASPGRGAAELTGKIYAAHTAGAAVGAIAFSLVLIPQLGTVHSQRLLIGLSGAAALILLVPLARGWKGLGSLAVSTALVCFLVWQVSELPWQAIAYGRRMATMIRSAQLSESTTDPATLLYRDEGMNSSLVITEEAGYRILYVSGKAEASSAPDDMRLQRMAGHIPALLHPGPRDVLVVGFGSGVTAGSFTVHPDIERIMISELEPLLPAAATRIFGNENYGVLDDPRTSVIYDDARHYILTTDDTFDVITSGPMHPWVKETSAHYSKEYFELLKRHLNPGGVAAQWVPLFDSDADTVKSVLATFFEAFPGGSVWSNNIAGRGYDLMLVGQIGATTIDVDELQHRLDQANYSAVTESLREVGFPSAVEVLATYLGRAADLTPWLAGAEVNLDRNQRLQYLAGLGLNSMGYPEILRTMLGYRYFPEGFIVGTGEDILTLRSTLQPGR